MKVNNQLKTEKTLSIDFSQRDRAMYGNFLQNVFRAEELVKTPKSPAPLTRNWNGTVTTY